MTNMLSIIIIYPLMQIMELVFVAFQASFYIPGLSVIGTGVVMTLLYMPLYVAAEKRREIEYAAETQIKSGIDRIRKTFTGKERHMMLSTFYKQNQYNPGIALSFLLGFLIRIPFFIAAYVFLPELQMLHGATFLFIRNLGASDSLVRIGKTPVNILPLITAVIDCIAGYMYTRRLTLKDKLLVYFTVLFFLIPVYNSSSALALFWMVNSVVLLIKNLYCKLENPRKALFFTSIGVLAAIDAGLIISGTGVIQCICFITLTVLLLFTPFLLHRTKIIAALTRFSDQKQTGIALFLLSSLVLCLATGLLSASNIIVSSPQEFSFIDSYTTPLFFLNNTLLQSIGIFLFWPLCIYFIVSGRSRTVLSAFSAVIALGALINVFLFPGHYGIMSPMLTFEKTDVFNISVVKTLLNIGVLCIPFPVVFFLIKHRKKTLISLLSVCVLGLAGVGIYNGITIQRSFRKLAAVYDSKPVDTVKSIFHLTKTGKNVFIIMLDRAVSGFIPTIFNEDPELKRIYSGFTYYPNTTSFGFFTIQGAAPLYGGYEYTPLEMNRRDKEPLMDKYDEALSVLPRIFAKNGYDATMADAPWAHFSWISDMSFMHSYPEKIRTLHTMGKYKDIWYREHHKELPAVQSTLNKRNFIWVGIMKDMPCFLRKVVYNEGDWWASASPDAAGDTLFLDSYSVLDFMPGLTDTSATTNTFTYIDNNTTHDPVLCQAPDYIPVSKVRNSVNAPFPNSEHYSANAAAIHRLATWIEYLKKEGVYDNTRIIISADHGRDVKTGQFSKERKLPFMREFCHPYLLVKDFNTTGAVKTDNTFMTNADVPSLAVKDIITNPVNPFTGKLITSKDEKNLVTITSSKNWLPSQQNKTTLAIAKNDWYTVHDNIFDENNWKSVSVPKQKANH